MSRKKLLPRPEWRFFLEIQPTVVFSSLEKFGSLSVLMSFSADDGDAVEFERAASELVLQCQSGRRRRADALASVRRSNCTCRFPAYSFHEDTRERECKPSEGIREMRFTKPNSS